MTTIKTPQTVSHAKGNSHGGHGFITMLLLITWVVIGAGFYGVKIGFFQPSDADPAVTSKIMELSNNLTALDTRLKILEKKLSDASTALNPAAEAPAENTAPVATDAVAEPTMPAPTSGSPAPLTKPEEAKPALPKTEEAKKTEEVKKPETATPAAPLEPLLSEPEPVPAPTKKDETAPAKPQTNKDKKNAPDTTAVFEKKNYI